MSYRAPFVEPLEGRRLMSGSILLPVVVPGLYGLAVPPALSNPIQIAEPPPLVPTAPATGSKENPSTVLTGSWDGRVSTKIAFFPLGFDAKLHITGQTATTLSGSLTIEGHTVNGTFTGKINPKNGRFQYTVKDGDDSITLTGRLNASGRTMYGRVKAKYLGFSAKGKFEFAKMSAT